MKRLFGAAAALALLCAASCADAGTASNVPNTLDVTVVGQVATPSGQLVVSSGNKANATAVATLGAAANKTTSISGFQCTASGATAGLAVDIVVTDGTWTLTYPFTFPAGVLVGAVPLVVPYGAPIAASGPNTAITVTMPASGTGGTAAACNAQGLQL